MSEPSGRSAARRILFLTPFPPRLDAPHGGGRTVARTILELAGRHRVAVLALRLPEDEPVDRALRERCEVVVEVLRPLVGVSPRRFWSERQRLRLMISRAPAWVLGSSVAEYGARLRALLRTWQPEVVQMEFAVMGQYTRNLPGWPERTILVDHDPEGGRSWARYRAAVLRMVDAAVVFTRRDEELLRQLAPTTRLARIPIGADVPKAALDPLGKEPPTLLFVGSYDHPPNVEAARRLATKIVPRVREGRPDLVLTLVGENPPADLAGPAVALVGRVQDVRPYLGEASIVAAPLDRGGGMRVKVLEALAAGKAIVASSLAVDGIEVTDGDQLVIADSDAEFAEAVLSLLADPQHRAALGARAHRWALANLGWERVARAYDALYESLLDADGDAAGPTRKP
jgi:glycosyltransferase involved in cell wall biosynthesis